MLVLGCCVCLGLYASVWVVKIKWITRGEALDQCGKVDIYLYQDDPADDFPALVVATIKEAYPNDVVGAAIFYPENLKDSSGDTFGPSIVGSGYEVTALPCQPFEFYFQLSLRNNFSRVKQLDLW